MVKYNSASARVDKEVASRMWKKGKSASQIGEFFDVTRNVIIGIATRNRELFPVDKPNRPEISNWRQRVDLAKAASMWRNEMTLAHIANHFDVYTHHISALAQERRDIFPKRTFGGNVGRASTTPRQRVKRVEDDRGEFVAKLFKSPSLTSYDEERLSQTRSLVDLERGECRWALSNCKPHMFCAAPAKGNYCEHHRLRSFRAA